MLKVSICIEPQFQITGPSESAFFFDKVGGHIQGNGIVFFFALNVLNSMENR